MYYTYSIKLIQSNIELVYRITEPVHRLEYNLLAPSFILDKSKPLVGWKFTGSSCLKV